MIEGLKPYAEYKESGLPWLGKTPVHWSTNRLRHACEMLVSNVDKHTKPNELPVLLCNYVDVYKNERIHRRLRFMRATASKDEVSRFRLRHGDVVITKDSEDWKDIGVPALVEHEAADFVCGYHLAILRPRPAFTSGSFLLRTLQCHLVAAQFHVEAHGVTRYGLGHGAIKGVRIPLPPPEEQAAIVRFLDHANRKIDGFIRAKRKLIGLLNEQKQAIIHRAVTRGLHPDVPLKPSGIPWLGDIPKHWDVRPIKHWTKINARTLGEATAASFEFRYIDIGAVRTGRLVAAPEVMRFDRSPSRARRVLVAGDTIISTVRTYLKAVWFAGENPVNLVASTGFAVFSPLASVEPEYLSYVLQDSGFVDQVTGNSVGIAYPAIAESVLARLRIAIPPSRSEQVGIIVAIKDQTGPLNTAISRTEREIALMQEYRTRLTADLVTGKLDVREAAAQLPAPPNDAPAPDEPLEEIETELEETNDASN